MDTVNLVALSDEHIPVVLVGSADWRELAQYGAPYWRPRSPAELRRKIAASAGPGVASEYYFVITEGDDVVGECSVHAIDWRSRVGQLGICIWDPARRGRGVGRAALEQLIEWSQGFLGLHRLEAWIVAGNDVSQRLFEHAGFSYEGTLRGRILIDGRHRDVNVLGLVPRASGPNVSGR